MCQIQLVHKFDGKTATLEDLGAFAELMCQGSYRNDDAWGWYDATNGKLFKKGGELSPEELSDVYDIKKTSTIFGHNRLKTKGDAKVNANNHPFETKNFVMVHNGMITYDKELKEANGFDYEVETDSFIIVALIERTYQKTKDLVLTIKEVAKILSGSFSVLVYCKSEDRLVYFKNDSTRFSMCLIKTKTGDVLLGSTDDDNFKSLYKENHRGMFLKRKYEMEVNTVGANSIIEIGKQALINHGKFDTITDYTLKKHAVWSEEKKTFVINEEAKAEYDKQFYSKPKNKGSSQAQLVDRAVVLQDKLKQELDKKRFRSLSAEEVATRDDVAEYLKEQLHDQMAGVKDLMVENCNHSVHSAKSWFVFSRELKHHEQKDIEDGMSPYGNCDFKNRKNSGKSELIIEWDMVMMEHYVTTRQSNSKAVKKYLSDDREASDKEITDAINAAINEEIVDVIRN